MAEGTSEHEKPAQLNRGGLSIVTVNGVRADRTGVSRKVMQCAACWQLTEYTDHEYCQMCGAGLSVANSDVSYSGYEPNLLPACHEIYYLKPSIRTVNERQSPRIRCRNVKASIKTEQGTHVIVNLVNISRGGVCFISDVDFCPETPVSIATHYIEGGQNIYQSATIVRVQNRPTAVLPGEYAIEFVR